MTALSITQTTNATSSELDQESSGQLNYQTLFWLFMLGSVAGFVVEGVCHIFKAGFWENHSAVVWGPFCIIYGIGAIVVYALSCCLTSKGRIQEFFVFSLSGSIIEYIASLFQETCFGSVSWDYSGHFLNIEGRVSLKMTLFWGVLGILFLEIIFPPINRVLCRMQSKGLSAVCVVLSVFMAVNLIVTVAALSRWQQRQNNIPAASAIEMALDSHFNDETMRGIFPNMRFQS